MAARDQARDLAPLADEAKRLASDLSHIGNPPRILGTRPLGCGASVLCGGWLRKSMQRVRIRMITYRMDTMTVGHLLLQNFSAI